jgi:hypothetical protein
MTLKLEVDPELELRLKQAAGQRRLGTEECALQLLSESLERGGATAVPVTVDPLMEMVGVDDFEPTSVDEVVYR